VGGLKRGLGVLSLLPMGETVRAVTVKPFYGDIEQTHFDLSQYASD
jgi:hypothetical protein